MNADRFGLVIVAVVAVGMVALSGAINYGAARYALWQATGIALPGF